VGDNTPVLFALQATYAKSERLNFLVSLIMEEVRALGIVLEVFYVPSAQNPADGLSRGSVFTSGDSAQTRLVAEQLLRRVVAVVAPIAGERAKPIFMPLESTSIKCDLCVSDSR